MSSLSAPPRLVAAGGHRWRAAAAPSAPPLHVPPRLPRLRRVGRLAVVVPLRALGRDVVAHVSSSSRSAFLAAEGRHIGRREVDDSWRCGRRTAARRLRRSAAAAAAATIGRSTSSSRNRRRRRGHHFHQRCARSALQSLDALAPAPDLRRRLGLLSAPVAGSLACLLSGVAEAALDSLARRSSHVPGVPAQCRASSRRSPGSS